jgi:hypothetical protein
MKSVIAIALIAGLGFAAWHYQQQARTLAAEVATLTEEAAANRRALEKAEKALAKAGSTPANQDAAKPTGTAPVAAGRTAPKESTATEPAAPTTPTPDPAAERAAKIAQLEAAYKQQRAAMDARQTEIDAARTRAQAYIDQAERNHPQFSEQTAKFDAAGRFIGNSGIRTSQADRERAMKIYNEGIAAAQAGMAKVDEEQAKLNTQRETAARQFNDAVDAARR